MESKDPDAQDDANSYILRMLEGTFVLTIFFSTVYAGILLRSARLIYSTNYLSFGFRKIRKEFYKKGGIQQAIADFQSLRPTDVGFVKMADRVVSLLFYRVRNVIVLDIITALCA